MAGPIYVFCYRLGSRVYNRVDEIRASYSYCGSIRASLMGSVMR